MSLSVKYRPKTFSEIVEQSSTKTILQRQLATNTFVNTYLFAGPSGDGKTTTARVFANEINHGQGSPIEIDAASNNGVDNIRLLIDESKTRSIDSEYKVIIVDEAHMITTAGWNAFLKCLEETPKYTIFIFCTTDPQKIPNTILNRTMRFNLSKISTNAIRDRLMYICEKEGYTNYQEACEYIAKISDGGMRNGISYLEKSAGYSSDLSIDNVIKALGNFSYELFLDLINAIVDDNEKCVLKIVDDIYNSGNDLKQFVEQFLDFVLDLNKYCLFKDISVTNIPASLEKPKNDRDTKCVRFAVSFDNSAKFFNNAVKELLDLKTMLRYDTSMRTTVSVKLLNLCRGVV